MRNISERPDGWVVIKITSKGETNYKVFGGWGGGYLDGDRWKLNSGISKVEEDDTNYYFYGYSGSCYQCGKEHYGRLTAYCYGTLTSIVDKGNSAGAEVEVMDKDTNWLGLA